MWQLEQNSARLIAVERLEEDFAVRLRIDVGQLVVHESEQRVVARREVVERRVLDLEVALAHRAADLGDRVAGRAAEARLRFRRVDLLLDRPIEPAVEEHRVIVAAGAPLGGLVPTTSCMYSIDLRYHWLLKEEKWWVEDCHWLKISVWQRPQLSLVMKKLAGMMPRTLVSAEEGKNGLCGPRPSCCMLAGTTVGF